MYGETYKNMINVVDAAVNASRNKVSAQTDSLIQRRRASKPQPQQQWTMAHELAGWLADFKGKWEDSKAEKEEVSDAGEPLDYQPSRRTTSRGRSGDTYQEPEFSTDGYEKKLVGAESSGRADAKASTSSATGLTQMTKSTWRNLVARHQPEWAKGKSDAEILAMREDGKKNMEMFRHLRRENQGILKNAGLPINNATEYSLHFLGPRAIRVWKAGNNEPMENLVPASFVEANRSVLEGKTVGQFKNWLHRKMS